MQIHICKPGGQREGPYSLEQINQDLAARRYRGADYWAWHEGLPEWVPLYSVPGIIDAPPEAEAKPSAAPAEVSPEPAPQVPAMAEPESAGAGEAAPAELDGTKLSSGMAFAALEQIFIVTTGDGPAASRSPVTTRMLQQITGEELQVIRKKVPRDAIAHCDILGGMKGKSSTPGAVWQAMEALKPELMDQARQGLFRICIRTFSIANGDLVSLFLFYNKEKL